MKKKNKIFLFLGIGAFLLLITKKTYTVVKKMALETPKDYIKLMYPIALKIQSKTGIPYLFMLAQTALETGYGKSSLFYKAFNIGGIKAKEGQPYVEAWTTEHVKDVSKYPNRDKTKDKDLGNGKTSIKIKAKFAKYDTLEQGAEAWTRIILLPRYKEAFEYKNDPKQFAAEIKAGGYATDVNYTAKMAKMIDTVKSLI